MRNLKGDRIFDSRKPPAERKRPEDAGPSAIRSFILICVCIFIIEAFEMLVIDRYLPEMDDYAVIFDPAFLVIFLSPILYLLVARPILRQVEQIRRAKAVIADENKKLESITSNSQDAVIMIDNDGRVIFWSAAAEVLFRYTRDEAVGKEVHSLIVSPSDAERQKAGFERFRSTGTGDFIGKVSEVTARSKDGLTFPVELSLSALLYEGKWCAVGTVRDISAKRIDEVRLRDSELRYRTLFEQSPEGVVLIDPESARHIDFNDAASAQLGYTRDEYSRLHVSDYEAIEDAGDVKRRMERILRYGSDIFETRHRTKNGDFINVIVAVKVIEISGKRYFYCLYRDVTEKRKAEEEMRLNAALLDSASDAIFVIGLDGSLLYYNDATCKAHGYTREEMKGLKISDLDAPDDAARSPERLKEIIEKGYVLFDVMHIKKDGTVFPMEAVSKCINYAGKMVVLSVNRDITEKTRSDKELNARIEELVRFQRAAVNREFRLKELNEKVAALESEIAVLKGAPREKT